MRDKSAPSRRSPFHPARPYYELEEPSLSTTLAMRIESRRVWFVVPPLGGTGENRLKAELRTESLQPPEARIDFPKMHALRSIAMYDYRTLTPAEQQTIVAERQRRGFPWHSPPHPEAPGSYRLLSAACFEHQPILRSSARLEWFEQELLNTLQQLGTPCAAWCVLSNHYQVLVQITNMRQFCRGLGRLHGRTSFQMNTEDGTRGRRVWYRSQDRCIRSEAHFYATLNYLHNNPVKHGYVLRWPSWPFSSFHWYLQTHGRDWLLDLWTRYPVLNYGAAWDDFVLEQPVVAGL